MTTIIFRRNEDSSVEFMSDSRRTSYGGQYEDNAEKIYETDKIVLACSGTVASIHALQDYILEYENQSIKLGACKFSEESLLRVLKYKLLSQFPKGNYSGLTIMDILLYFKDTKRLYSSIKNNIFYMQENKSKFISIGSGAKYINADSSAQLEDIMIKAISKDQFSGGSISHKIYR